jgi:hypothetical protein
MDGDIKPAKTLRSWSNLSAWEKGERLAKLVAHRRTLLVLDGLEPLQNPPGIQEGRLRDPSLQALLSEVATFNSGLCVITTRLPVADLVDYERTSVQRYELERRKGTGCSPNSMRRCLANMELRTPTSAKARIHTLNSRTPVLASVRLRRKKARRNLCSSSFPSETICRFWRSWPPSIAIATGWTSYSTGSVTIMVVQLSRLAVRSTLAPIYFARPDALPACKSAPVKRSTFLSATNKLIASVNSC